MKRILIAIAVIVLLLIAYSYYMGAFKSIEITEEETGPFKVVFEEHIGDYKGTGEIMDRLYYSVLDEGIDTTKGFGIYYDDPKIVKKEELKSEAGVILEVKDYDKVSQLEGKYRIKTLNKKVRITTEFVYKNKASVFFGIMKVYPTIEKYIEEKGYKKGSVMEIYDIPNNKIIYLAEIKE